MREWCILAATLSVLAFATVGAAQAGIENPTTSTPTELYFHLLDSQNDFPINTQVPDPEFARGAKTGTATHTTSCLPAAPGAGITSKEHHTLYGYSSPSLVEYDYIVNNQPRVHPERGFSYDILLDTQVTPTLRWYLSTSIGPDAADSVVAAVPNVVVRATMREGGDISNEGEEAYNYGAILAIGESEPAHLAGPATQGGATYIEGDIPVYEFEFEMPIQDDKIGAALGYVMRIDVFLDNPACADGEYLMPNTVKHHTSEIARPGMSLATKNPLMISAIHPQFIGDELVVHTMLNSPWGSYDVDEQGGVTVTIDGPSIPRNVQHVYVDNIHDHDTHFESLAYTVIWPYVEEGAVDGQYTVHVSAWNDQGTAEAVGTASFAIGDDTNVCSVDTEQEICVTGTPGGPKKDSPAAPLFMTLVLTLAAAAWFRRGGA